MKHDKYYNFVGGINDDNLNKLIDFLNSNAGTILVNLNSSGGDMWLGSFITKMLNENKERISLVACGIYSTAFRIFYFFEGKKYICDSSRGMYHYPNREIYFNDNGLPTYIDGDTVKKSLPIQKKKTLEFVSKFLTKSEMKKFKRGIDVYFTSERLQEIFPDAEII